MKKFLQSFKTLLMGLFLLIAGLASAQSDTMYLHQGVNVASINTGAQFLDTIKYSFTKLTGTFSNAIAVISLPQNVIPAISNFSNSYQNFDPSQVASVTYDGLSNTITIHFINPIAGGNSGAGELLLQYANGSTPNGYAPIITTTISATNWLDITSSIHSPGRDTTSVTAIATNNFTISKSVKDGGAFGDVTNYLLTINHGGAGSLDLKNPVVVDQLPVGAVFITATNFKGSSFNYDAGANTVTWSWTTDTILSGSSYGSSAFVSVAYPGTVLGQSICNNVSFSGTNPVDLIGGTTPVTTPGSVCESLASPTPTADCSGGGISAANAHYIGNYILDGTTGNWFTEGWTNTGNTSIAHVDYTYNIDNFINFTTIHINPVYDAFGLIVPVNVDVTYVTNISTYNITFTPNQIGNGTTYTPVLGVGEYITSVEFNVGTTSGSLPLGAHQDLSYSGDILSVGRDGKGIIEGTWGTTPLGLDGGTVISNNSGGSFTDNSSTTTMFSSCAGSSEVISPQPAFNATAKNVTNGYNNSFKASDTVNYQFYTHLGGNAPVTNVIVKDTLDNRLLYVPGTTTFEVKNSGTYTSTGIASAPTPNQSATSITPDTTRTTDGTNRMILTFHLSDALGGSITPIVDLYINVGIEVVPGTAPGVIKNTFTLSADHSLFTGSTDSTAINVLSAVAIRAYKGQSGCDASAGFVYYPTVASAQAGGPVDYKITVKNLGNVVANNLVLVDVFPFKNDYRGSQVGANLFTPVSISDPSTTVYYTTVSNPCYTDFTPATNPSGCNTPSWSTTPPIDITTVTALKLTRSADLNVLDSINLTWKMRAPVGVPSGKIMNNSIEYQVDGVGFGQLLPAVPNQVGMNTSCISPLGSIGNYCWLDTNKNGLQDEPANLGLNGVKVYLYQVIAGVNTLIDSTITGNDFSGNPGYYLFTNVSDGQYYVKFPKVFNQNYLTPVTNQTPELDDNSDVDSTAGFSGVITITVANGGQDKDNTTIDAGYFPTGTLGNYVWFDANTNGLQDDGSANGINGAKVVLLKDDGSGNFVRIDSTTTSNDVNNSPGYYKFIIQSSGNYIVNFPTTNNTTDILTSGNFAVGVDGNSDANFYTGNSPIVVMDVYNNGHDGIPKNNPTIDAGYHCTTDAGTDQTVCAGASVILTGNRPSSGGTWKVLGSPSGVTLTPSTSNSSIDTVQFAVSSVTDTFQFVYTFGYCTDTMNVIVLGKPSAGGIQYICGGKLATLTGTNPSNGTWTAFNTNPLGSLFTISSSPNIATVSFNDSANGIFKYVYTSPNQCTDTATLSVIAKPEAGLDQSICAGNTVVLTGLRPTSGTWYTISGNPSGSTLSSTTVGVATASYAPTAEGQYKYKYKYSYCTDTIDINVVQPMADIVLSLGGISIYPQVAKVCVGSHATLSDANTGGRWYSSDTTAAKIDISTGVVTGLKYGLTLITYKVDSLTVCGCNTKTFYMYVDSAPNVAPIIGSNIVCVGSTIMLNDITGGGVWTANNANATVIGSYVTGQTPGTVTIKYTATNGCGTDYKTKDITVCQPISPIIGTNHLCVGANLAFTDATVGGTWSSSDASIASVDASGSVTAISGGSVNIIYTAVGASCCSDNVSLSLTVDTLPVVADITGLTSVCTGNRITLTDLSNGGVWSTSDNTIASVINYGNYGFVDGVSTGTATIKYTITNTCGTVFKPVTINVGNAALANNTGVYNICVGSSAPFSNTTVGGTWSSSDNSIATVDASTGMVTGIAPGYVNITYTVASGSVCGSNTATTNIYINAIPTLAPITGGGVVCQGSYITLSEPSGGGIWSSDNTNIATVDYGGNVYGVTVGTTTIRYTASYYCGGVLNTLVQTATVYVQGSLAGITGNTNICLSSPTTTLSDVILGGLWSSSDVSLATVDNFGVVTALAIGTPTISYTVPSGSVCGSNIATANIVITATPSLAPITGTSTICLGTTTTLDCASGGGTWSSDNHSVATIDNNGQVSTVGSGTVNISYSAVTTCGSATEPILFTVSPLPSTPTISGTLVVCNGIGTTLTSSSTSGNQWYKDGDSIIGANSQTLSVSDTGTYTVTTTGTCVSLASLPSVVTNGVVNGFTININPQELGGNNFVFTSSTPTAHNSYVWDFGDGTSTTSINSSRTYAAADTYAVKQIVTNTINGCMDSTTHVAIVYSCCVTSGSTGGTESKSLGNVISQRFYNRVTNSISDKINYAQLTKVVSLPGVQVMGAGSGVTLQGLLPSQNAVANVLGGTIDVYSSSPTDLVSFTNALDVSAQDYTKNTSCKAVAFVTKTSGIIYSHTKPVCDRLKEAQLLDIQNVTIGNTTMVQYKIRQYTGETEYGISFSAGKNANSSFYEIQSKWLTEEYTGSDTMYNFELWGVSPQVISSMVTDVLNNLNNSLPYYQLSYSPIPNTYIVSHVRNQKTMDVTINNNTSSTSANLYVTDYMNELSAPLPYRIVPVTINPNGKTTVSIDMGDKYQANVQMYDGSNSIVNDEIYSNDGPWDISYNAATTNVNQFSIANDGLTPASNEWRLFRNVTVNAITKDYISVFKLMKAGGIPRDISAYNGFKFTATTSGVSSISITFTKNSITDWSQQYTVTIPAKDGTNDYTIKYSDLASAGLGSIDASDVTAITISLIVNNGVSTKLSATLSNAKLITSNVVVPPVVPVVDNTLSIRPNPILNGTFKCVFNDLSAETLQLKVVEIATGKVIYTQPFNSVAGSNTINVQLPGSLLNTGIYTVSLEGGSIKYELQNIKSVK